MEEIKQEVEQAQEAAAEAAQTPVITRRNLCLGAAGAAVLLGMGAIKFAGDTPVVRPPGGQDYAQVVSACIRCEKCVEICPNHIIKPAHLEDGLLGMRTPVLDFSSSYCDWCAEANDGKPLCVEACPTKALKLPADATAETLILGKAELNRDYCLAYRLIGCKFCYDACPYEAMYLDEEGRPVVIADKCNGCGACEAVCVSLQNGSISAGAKERAIVVRAE